MSAGLWLLLILLAVAQLAALLGRHRILIRRRWAADDADAGWAGELARGGMYFLTGADGAVYVGSNPAIRPGTMIVGQMPRLLLEEGPLYVTPEGPDDLDAEMRRWRLSQEIRLAAVARDASRRPFNITGV